MHTNGCVDTFKKQAKLNIFPLKVHFKKELTATILFFPDVCNTDGLKVILDLKLGIHFDFIFQTGKTFLFKCFHTKLFYSNNAVDNTSSQTNVGSYKSKDEIIDYSHLQIGTDNKSSYTREGINKADDSRRIYGVIVFPSNVKLN